MAEEKPAEEQEAAAETPQAPGADAQASEDKETAQKPKPRRRTSKPKVESGADEATKAVAQEAAEPGEETQAPKKPRRTRTKKATEASAETEEAAGQTQADEQEAEPAKPKRRRSQPAAEEAPAEPEDKPAPRPAPAADLDGRVRVVRAQARYVRTSARKARLVCDHLRGKSVDEARAILAFNPRGVARDWSKVLESAVANAENNHELIAEDLVVREAFADEGPTIKRFQPRARGRAASIRKRTSHLTITLAPQRR
jgi:ribosomal protein L22